MNSLFEWGSVKYRRLINAVVIVLLSLPIISWFNGVISVFNAFVTVFHNDVHNAFMVVHVNGRPFIHIFVINYFTIYCNDKYLDINAIT